MTFAGTQIPIQMEHEQIDARTKAPTESTEQLYEKLDQIFEYDVRETEDILSDPKLMLEINKSIKQIKEGKTKTFEEVFGTSL